jgi:aspartyl-tRNA(Asn)/glutamyl-tRNA(Gln) amidotransferase subunit A
VAAEEQVRPAGSRAREAFEDARRALADYHPEPSRRPGIDLAPAPLSRRRLPPLGADEAGAPVGGALDAVRAQWEEALDATTLVEAALDAAERHAALAGVVHLDPDGARADALACDAARAAGRRLGPLHGVPVTVKDVIDVAGMPTRAGSDAYDARPSRDAAGVARLRAAGAIVLGKVATHEFALGVTTPQSRNPHDPERIPGGSSGGSAIAVATGIGLGSLGTDTRASIRVPPALCGLVGFKPTYGRVPTDGVVTLSWTMDHVAPIAAGVEDAAALLEVLAPELDGLRAWARADVEGMRVGVPGATFDGADPEVTAAVEGGIARLEAAGVRVRPAGRPDARDLERANAAGLVISRAEAAVVHRDLGLDRSLYWEETADQLAEAERLTAMDYLTAQRMRAELADALAEALRGLDALVMPTTPVAAPLVAEFAEYLTVLSRNAIPWSLVGFPAISVPCGVTAHGLPVGLQIVAAPGREATLVALGAALERTAPGPPLPAAAGGVGDPAR